MGEESAKKSGKGSVDPGDQLLKGLLESLVDNLKRGDGDRDGRGQVEGWLRALAEKYSEYDIESGLRDYYRAEAGRLRAEFDATENLIERLNIGRLLESFLEKASEIERRRSDEAPE